MATTFRLAVTADLHWGSHGRGDDATRLLAAYLQARPPDLLILAGDIGAGDQFARCMELFADLPCRKALVPGNHDIWVTGDDARGDSWAVYERHLPDLCRLHGFHYLDAGPLLLPDVGLSVIGSINWYDYSWALERLRREVPDWQDRLRRKRFTRGRLNDARFVRWAFDDPGFTAFVVEKLADHLDEAERLPGPVVAVTHHPPFYGLGFPRAHPPSGVDALLWDAFTGNRAVEELFARHAARIRFAFCGHTHRAREHEYAGIRGYNVGGDYDHKRLLWLDEPAGRVEFHEFGGCRAKPDSQAVP